MRLIGLSMFCCVMAGAANFSKADAFFEKRENNREAIHQAKIFYRQILEEQVDRDLKIAHAAMDQIGRLAYYEGELLLSMDQEDERKEIFAECQKLAEKVDYPYWVAACLGLWTQSAGLMAGWWYLDDFKQAIARALIENQTVHEGGVYRLLAAVNAKTVYLQPYGLYNPALALQYADKAFELGSEHLSTYLIKADVLIELGRSEEAKKVLEGAWKIFSARLDLSPENKVLLGRLKNRVN